MIPMPKIGSISLLSRFLARFLSRLSRFLALPRNAKLEALPPVPNRKNSDLLRLN